MLAEKVYNSIINYYENISSNSHMDNDIARDNGVLEKYSDKYDPNFIRNMFDIPNISAIKRINHYQNIQTGIDDKTLLESIKKGDFISVGLCIIDEYLINEISDGFVEVSSQEAVEDKIEKDNIRFNSTTHNVIKSKTEMDKLMQILEDNLLETKDIQEIEKNHSIWADNLLFLLFKTKDINTWNDLIYIEMNSQSNAKCTIGTKIGTI